MTALPQLEGFPPIVGDGARTLILGNMPGAISLAAGQYYANPRNAFWQIMADVFEFGVDEPYERRVAELVRHGVAVWDVLRSCRRVGSLDAAIDRNSMIINDFASFFAEYRDITRVYFNGAAAEKNFTSLAATGFQAEYLRLPSTSPAHAIPYPRKLAAWRAIGASRCPSSRARRDGSKSSSRIRQE